MRDVLVEVASDTELRLPHLSWSADAREVVLAACEASKGRVPALVEYRGADGTSPTFHVPVDAVADEKLLGGLRGLAEGLYEYRPPEPEAAVLTGMVGCDELLFVFAWLRSALIELSGPSWAAHVVPTGGSGSRANANGPFPLHADQWHTELLFNVFNRVRPGGETVLLSVEEALAIAREHGLPEAGVEAARFALSEATTTACFRDFNRWVSDWPGNALGGGIAEALLNAAVPVAMKRGQGYLVNDRKWLHGRLAIDWPAGTDRNHRLYRLGYNNRPTMERASRRDAG